MGESTIIHEYSLEKVQEKIKEGNDNDNWENIEVIIPETVTGIVNGNKVEFHPLENWGTPGLGVYGHNVNKDENGRYWIAVSPKIMNANYPDDGEVLKDEFNYGKINLVLVDVNTNKEEILQCIIGDTKAHSYNKYPYDTGNIASVDVENGLLQTGIAYPKSWNARHNQEYVPSTMACSVIEFMGGNPDIDIGNYKLKSIIIIEE